MTKRYLESAGVVVDIFWVAASQNRCPQYVDILLGGHTAHSGFDDQSKIFRRIWLSVSKAYPASQKLCDSVVFRGVIWLGAYQVGVAVPARFSSGGRSSHASRHELTTPYFVNVVVSDVRC